MFAEDIPAKLFMRFLRMITHIAYERSGLAHGNKPRHLRYIIRRYLLREDFEISCYFLLFHLVFRVVLVAVSRRVLGCGARQRGALVYAKHTPWCQSGF